jgi:hypothetical protein
MDCTESNEIFGGIYSYTLPPLACQRKPPSSRSASRSLVITMVEGNSFNCRFGSDTRRLFVILGLLLCMIAARADEVLVIKDSEAAQYVGKKVEVRGFVVSVTTSPLGTTFINCGREYPNQIFAGFIAGRVKKGRLSDGPQRSKGKSSESPAQSRFTKGSQRSKCCR